ncbi:hypothetical protein [Eubacterium limosum]|uniref:hypothetical protein n=1 Tax=Eubacterium limosum TaxID=1736 RepID=UPI0037138EA0
MENDGANLSLADLIGAACSRDDCGVWSSWRHDTRFGLSIRRQALGQTPRRCALR